MRVLDGPAKTVLESVRSGAADFAVGYISEGERASTFEPLFEGEIVGLVRSDNGLAGTGVVRWSQIRGR